MKRHALIAILILLLNGCAHRAGSKNNPDVNRNIPDIDRITQLEELTGVYKNEGPNEYYLSNVIWGDTFPTVNREGHPAHASVALIELSSTNNSLTAKAIQNGCIISVKTYVIGRDLEIEHDQVIIHRRLGSPSREPQDATAGLDNEKITLGIDAAKPGKYKPLSSTASQTMLFVLFATSDNHDVRFERVTGKPKVFRACDNH